MFLAAGGRAAAAAGAGHHGRRLPGRGQRNVFNCVLDRDIDERMRRTRRRPLPRHAVEPRAATIFGAVLGRRRDALAGFCRQLAVGRAGARRPTPFYVFVLHHAG